MCSFHALLNITGSRCDSACKHLPRIMAGISDDTVPFLAVYNSTQPSCLAKNKCLCICMAFGQKEKKKWTHWHGNLQQHDWRWAHANECYQRQSVINVLSIEIAWCHITPPIATPAEPKEKNLGGLHRRRDTSSKGCVECCLNHCTSVINRNTASLFLFAFFDFIVAHFKYLASPCLFLHKKWV